MVSLAQAGSASEQKISVTIESYLAVLSQPSNRTYMDQSRYDSGDNSAAAAIAIANGNFTGALAGSGGASGGQYFGGGGGSSGEGRFWNNLQ